MAYKTVIFWLFLIAASSVLAVEQEAEKEVKEIEKNSDLEAESSHGLGYVSPYLYGGYYGNPISYYGSYGKLGLGGYGLGYGKLGYGLGYGKLGYGLGYGYGYGKYPFYSYGKGLGYQGYSPYYYGYDGYFGYPYQGGYYHG